MIFLREHTKELKLRDGYTGLAYGWKSNNFCER